MSNINFNHPLWLWFALPMAVLILVPFFIAIKKGSFSFKNITSLVLHLIICVFVTLVLAGMTLEIVITETNVYVVADVSYSSHEMLEKEDSYIADLSKNLPKNSKMGLVCFGKDSELVTEVGDKMKSVSTSSVDTSETNIAGALEYTATLFDQSVIKRIVLITDGKETRKSGIVSVIAALEKQDIYVDAIFLDNNIPEGRQEVQINSIDYSPSTFKDKQEEVYTLIQSTVDTEATLKLIKGDTSTQKKINLNKGLNTVSMALDTSLAGTFDYQLEIETSNDTSPFNNVVLLRQSVTEKVKMMFVSGSANDKTYAEKLYGDQAEIDYYINVTDVPYSLEDLALY
ncbi:MAG: VWA domain-containing protein, partial [Anaeroplasmataceae bacterium]|nr:VWA domain-containing protein [Anaeroplasmataceae bacterium]